MNRVIERLWPPISVANATPGPDQKEGGNRRHQIGQGRLQIVEESLEVADQGATATERSMNSRMAPRPIQAN